MSVCSLPGLSQDLIDSSLFGLRRGHLLGSVHFVVLGDQQPGHKNRSKGSGLRVFECAKECPLLGS